MADNIDFNIFQEEVPWFVKPNMVIDFTDTDTRLSIEFKNTFPKLTRLIEKARFTIVNINAVEHRLFAWTTRDNNVCGWLNRIDEPDSYTCEMVPEHEVLIRNIGGILESFNQPDNSFTNNQNFMYSGSECSRGIGDYDDYYEMMCEDENCVKIDYADFLVFAYEANGALTMYNPHSKAVLLFSHDHSFDNVNFMEGQPRFTFHTFNGVNTFIDYVETLADQWLEFTR